MTLYHYALIANIDLAEANAIALLRSEMSDEEFYELGQCNETTASTIRPCNRVGTVC